MTDVPSMSRIAELLPGSADPWGSYARWVSSAHRERL